MAISVTYGGDPVAKSPFHITVAPPLDIGRVKVEGLDKSKFQTLNYCVYHVKIAKVYVFSDLLSCRSGGWKGSGVHS